MTKLFGASYKTGILGALGIIASLGTAASLLLHKNFNFGSPEWIGVGTGLTTAIGVFNARDDKVTSEQAKANP